MAKWHSFRKRWKNKKVYMDKYGREYIKGLYGKKVYILRIEPTESEQKYYYGASGF